MSKTLNENCTHGNKLFEDCDKCGESGANNSALLSKKLITKFFLDLDETLKEFFKENNITKESIKIPMSIAVLRNSAISIFATSAYRLTEYLNETSVKIVSQEVDKVLNALSDSKYIHNLDDLT